MKAAWCVRRGEFEALREISFCLSSGCENLPSKPLQGRTWLTIIIGTGMRELVTQTEPDGRAHADASIPPGARYRCSSRVRSLS
jgi:hypothetical protein